MTTRKITEEEVKAIFDEDYSDYEIVEVGVWIDEGKYQNATTIVKDKEGLFWAAYATKSGSYFSDYEYQYEEELTQVEKKEVLVTQWLVVE